MQNETRFKVKVRKLLAELPIWVVKTQQRSVRGTPDFLMCVAGRFVAWELKDLDGKASSLQLYNLAQIEKCGGIGRIVDANNLEEELRCLKDLLQQS